MNQSSLWPTGSRYFYSIFICSSQGSSPFQATEAWAKIIRKRKNAKFHCLACGCVPTYGVYREAVLRTRNVFFVWILICESIYHWFRIRILLFSSVMQKKPTNFRTFLLIAYGTVGTFTSVFKNSKLFSCHQNVEIKIFLHLFLLTIKGSRSSPEPDPDPSVQIITDLHTDPGGPNSWGSVSGKLNRSKWRLANTVQYKVDFFMLHSKSIWPCDCSVGCLDHIYILRSGEHRFPCFHIIFLVESKLATRTFYAVFYLWMLLVNLHLHLLLNEFPPLPIPI